MSIENEIKNAAKELGFDLVGITDASALEASQKQYMKQWLKMGCSADMQYLQRNLEKRFDPAALFEPAQSIVAVGLNYTQKDAAQQGHLPGCGCVSMYACYEDYHDFIKSRLRKLVEKISQIAQSPIEYKMCVDSVPFAERAFARRAGLGFIGKNHMLIHSQLGCQIFLGFLLLNLELVPDRPCEMSCSDCDQCLRACPTGALGPDGSFDARKCISYLTIEHRGEIPESHKANIGNRVFGCDECVNACPYQKTAPVCANREIRYFSELHLLNLQEILMLSEQDFANRFGKTPIARAGLHGLQRNARICLANEK